MDKLVEELQSTILTVIEKALPRIDIELPPGLAIGIESRPGDVAAGRGELSKAEIARGDRELAAAFAILFADLKNSKALCVAFRNEKLARLARSNWKDIGALKIISLPNPKQASFGAPKTVQQIAGRPFVIAVAPSAEQLVQLQELDEARGGKFCLIMLNARLRVLEESDELREDLATASNPAFHVAFAGPDGQGLVYHRLGQPWVVARRKDDGGGFEEVWRNDEEPSFQQVESALAR